MRGHRGRRGIAHIWLVLLMMAILGMIGLAIDIAYIVLAGQQFQGAADAAALAGGRMVKFDPPVAREDAMAIAAENAVAFDPIQLRPNTENTETGDIVLGIYDRDDATFTPSVNQANAVKVTARRTADSPNGPLPLLFGPALGIDETSLSRTAIAMVGGSTGAGVIALDRTAPCTLDVRGSSTELNVVNEATGEAGSIIVNSADENGLCHSGQPTIRAHEILVQGHYDKGFDTQVNYDGPIYPGAAPRPDPLRHLPEPGYDTANDLGTVEMSGNSQTTRTLQPGYYSGGISMNNDKARLELEPGIYVLDGEGLNIRGGDLIAKGVMFHIVDTTPDDKTESRVRLGGNGIVHLTPRTPACIPSTGPTSTRASPSSRPAITPPRPPSAAPTTWTSTAPSTSPATTSASAAPATGSGRN